VLTFGPFVLVVGAGETRALEDTVLQVQSGTLPGVAVALSDVRVLGLGEVGVPVAGATNADDLVLGFEDASVVGPGVLTNAGRLAGPGRVEAALVNASGGRVEVVDGPMVFSAPVVNQAGATIDAIDAALDFAAGGLANSGALRLVDALVVGTVENALGAAPALAGTSTFTGAVSGPASFSGTGTAVFAGSYAPGASPALVAFAGDVVFAPGSTLALEIEGGAPGAGYDRLEIAGSATFGGTLDLSLGAFEPSAGQSFDVLAHGPRSGEFDVVSGVQATPSLDLALAYGADVSSITAVLRGDVDRDGVVDIDDVEVVEQNEGATTTDYTRGDVNGDGAVDQQDLGIVMTAAGLAVPSLSAGGAVLLAAVLVGSALAALCRRPRRAAPPAR
jgi:hypothetical protein